MLRQVGEGEDAQLPPGPVDGSNPLDLVRDFVFASGSSADRHGAARRFLAPTADWNDGHDQKVDLPTGAPETKWPAEQYDRCPQQMMGLSTDWNAMNTLVESLSPNGSTNQPIGLVWGWQSLVGGGPLTAPAKDPLYKYTEIVILMSDGLNTQDRWYGNGYQTNTSVDARMLSPNTSTGAGTARTSRIPASFSLRSMSTPTATRCRRCCRTVRAPIRPSPRARSSFT